MAKMDPAKRKSVDVTVQVFRVGNSIAIAGDFDVINIHPASHAAAYKKLDQFLKAKGK